MPNNNISFNSLIQLNRVFTVVFFSENYIQQLAQHARYKAATTRNVFTHAARYGFIRVAKEQRIEQLVDGDQDVEKVIFHG